MTRKPSRAFEIAEGLKEALAFARCEVKGARLHSGRSKSQEQAKGEHRNEARFSIRADSDHARA
jgi:hypothetical protein